MTGVRKLTSPIDGLAVIEREPIGDARGSFARLFCDEVYAALGWPGRVRQINHSRTRGAGSVRGMHFQRAPALEAKLVTCLAGTVFDVAVDLRRGSPTFLHWHGVELAGGDARSFLIPEGFAHGFQVLSDEAELLYFHSAPYDRDHEGGLAPSDPALAIAWPLPIANLSARDAAHPAIDDHFAGIVL